MPSYLPFDTVAQLALFKMYELTASNERTRFSPADIAKIFDGGISAGLVDVAFNQLAENHWIVQEGVQGGGKVATITPRGIREAEQKAYTDNTIVSDYLRRGLEAFDDKLISTDPVPAADRWIDRSHNRASYDEAVSLIEELESSLLKGNEAGDIFGEDRGEVAAELGLLKSFMARVRVRASVVGALAGKTLGWIAEKAAGAAIGDLAKRALSAFYMWLN